MGDPQVLREALADDSLLVTPEEAAALLRVGRTTIYALMKVGDLRSIHIGRSCRLSRAELERYVTGLTSSAPHHAAGAPRHSTAEHDSLGSLHSRPTAD